MYDARTETWMLYNYVGIIIIYARAYEFFQTITETDEMAEKIIIRSYARREIIIQYYNIL